jgi:hypothetical protein
MSARPSEGNPAGDEPQPILLLRAIDEAELASLAAAIPIPVDAFGPSRAYAEAVSDGPDHAPDAPCSHRSGYRVFFGLDGGRRREPVGPVFERPREAVRLAELLTGASGTGGSSAGPSADAGQPRVCIVCEQPLPAGSRSHRRTCSVACRQRLGRQGGAAEQGSRGPKATDIGTVTPAAVSARPSARRQKPAREPHAPPERVNAKPVDVRATPPSPQGARRSAAAAGQLELNLIPNMKTAVRDVYAISTLAL